MLTDFQVRISDSPTNGKARVIDINIIDIDILNSQISVWTKRRFFEKDENDIDGIGAEVNGVEYPVYNFTLVANNQRLCNPVDGVMVALSGATDASGNTTNYYVDPSGNIVANPIGLFDFFKQYLTIPIIIKDFIKLNILREDSLYNTWNK
jgi:hypothetical protein